MEQSLGGAPSCSMGDEPRQLRCPSRLSPIRNRDRLDPTREGPTPPASVPATPAICPQLHLDRSSLNGEILQPSQTHTVATHRPNAAVRAA